MEEIAIIGMSGQFPQSPTIDDFWNNLKCGRELITFFSDTELLEGGLDPAILANPAYVKAKGFLSDADCFDAEFFGYSAREAEVIDPQQRLLLEWASIALESAGYDPEQFEGLIGVFASSSLSSYFYLNLFSHLYGSFGKSQDEMLMVMGNEKDFLATRIAYKLNLKGPAKSIQTACSSSLVAIHDACQSLLNFECDIALAGGISITFPLKNGYFYTKEGINSPDGHCRAFDHLSAGTLIGNGGGIVVLKRLSEALEEGDTIHAIIKGSSVNNDGAQKIGFTAPSIEGQANAIIASQLAAKVAPETITYIECHGTGTILGDPVEIKALTAAFEARTDAKQFCAIGSVKTNIGHLDAASGVAGLIKTVLSLKNRQIPASLHFEKSNPKIDFDQTPFYVNTQLTPWVSKHPLRAGVSSFGIGGTNAHVILEEAPVQQIDWATSTEHLLCPFSAKTEKALKKMLSHFLNAFSHLTYPLEDIVYTLQVGRKAYEKRVCFLASSKEELFKVIESYVQSGQSLNSGASDLHLLGLRWSKGEMIQWPISLHQKRRRVPLPTYPFEKKRYHLAPRNLHSKFVPSQTVDKHLLTRRENYVAPENNIEKHLTALWEKSLRVEGIGLRDDFFQLGGDSLLALEIVDGVRLLYRIDMNLQHIFDNPTISQFAKLLEMEIFQKIEQMGEEEASHLLELV